MKRNPRCPELPFTRGSALKISGIQVDALRIYAQARDCEVASEYVDRGLSGAKDRRPALDRLLFDARRRRFDLVACVKLDRLTRSVHHLTSLAREFEALALISSSWTRLSTRARPLVGSYSMSWVASRSSSDP